MSILGSTVAALFVLNYFQLMAMSYKFPVLAKERQVDTRKPTLLVVDEKLLSLFKAIPSIIVDPLDEWQRLYAGFTFDSVGFTVGEDVPGKHGLIRAMSGIEFALFSPLIFSKVKSVLGSGAFPF